MLQLVGTKNMAEHSWIEKRGNVVGCYSSSWFMNITRAFMNIRTDLEFLNCGSTWHYLGHFFLGTVWTFSVCLNWWFWDDHYCFLWAGWVQFEEILFPWHILYIMPTAAASLNELQTIMLALASVSKVQKLLTCISQLPSGCFHSIYIIMLFLILGTDISRWMNKQLGQYYFVSCQLWMSHSSLRFIWKFSSKTMPSGSHESIVLCLFLCLL